MLKEFKNQPLSECSKNLAQRCLDARTFERTDAHKSRFLFFFRTSYILDMRKT